MNWRLLSVSELSSRTTISESRIYRLVRRRRIPFLKVDGRIVFRETSIDEWMTTQEQAPTSGQTATTGKRPRTPEDECARLGVPVNHRFSSYPGGKR